VTITPALIVSLLSGLSDGPASPAQAIPRRSDGGSLDIVRRLREVYAALRTEPIPAHLLALVERLHRERSP
jgi:hypothetical protein